MTYRLRPWLIPYNKTTSAQVINAGMLSVWTALLVANHDDYEASQAYAALAIAPDVYWWAFGTALLTVISILPMTRWWRHHVNHSYMTKTLGMVLSAGWWVFIAAIFFVAGGPNLGACAHVVLAVGCLYESMQISKVAQS